MLPPQSLDADALFAGESGTSVTSHRGYALYDVRAVKAALLQRLVCRHFWQGNKVLLCAGCLMV